MLIRQYFRSGWSMCSICWFKTWYCTSCCL